MYHNMNSYDNFDSVYCIDDFSIFTYMYILYIELGHRLVRTEDSGCLVGASAKPPIF